MSRPLTIQDIETFEATVDLLCTDLKKKAAKLRRMLADNPSATPRAVSKKRIAEMIVKRERRIQTV